MKIPIGNFTYLPHHTAPVGLDVVWCAFPKVEEPDLPAVKQRPALVRAVGLYAKGTKVAVEITYGTSKVHKLGPLDLVVGNTVELDAAGLYQQSGFMLERTQWLPWCSEFFPVKEGYKTPIIGHLHPNTIAQLQAIKVYRRQPSR